MIINQHPMLAALNDAPFTFHLIGSRYVGKFSETSDYDFLGVAKDYTEWKALSKWLADHEFAVYGDGGYGPDRRLYGTNVWTWKGNETYPAIDVLPVSFDEATLRLQWFAAMSTIGDKAGLIAKALKTEEAWPLFWDVLEKMLQKDRTY